MVIHRFIHSLWITARNRRREAAVRLTWPRFWPRHKTDDLGYMRIKEAVLQHFSARCAGKVDVREGGLAAGIAGWRCWLRIYSYRSSEHFGVPVEEFDEAYLSAKSSQESQDARLPQAHEFGGRTQDRREPPAPGPQAPGSLTVVTQEAHASD